MFKIIECEQRSEEWYHARLGKWTASFFDKAITPTGKKSTSAEDVNLRLVAELIVGNPDETFQSEAMLRGAELEDEALEFINFAYGFNFEKVGFMDSGLGYGCSVDAFDRSRGLTLEMKCPLLHTHLKYLAGGDVPKDHKQQFQGAMLVTGHAEKVFMSYHPGIKPLVVIGKRDNEYIKSMRDILLENCHEVKKKYAELTHVLAS